MHLIPALLQLVHACHMVHHLFFKKGKPHIMFLLMHSLCETSRQPQEWEIIVLPSSEQILDAERMRESGVVITVNSVTVLAKGIPFQ